MSQEQIIKVDPGSQLTLSLENASSLGSSIVHLQPKNPHALKVLAGIPSNTKALRLTDTNAFEVLNDPGRMIHLQPDEKNEINGIKSTLVKAIISSLSQSQNKMPEKLQIERRRRTSLGRVVKSQIGDIVSRQEVLLPSWLHTLQVYNYGIKLKSIEVGENSYFYINVSNLICDNFYIGKGAKVIVLAPYLNLDIRGKFSGEGD